MGNTFIGEEIHDYAGLKRLEFLMQFPGVILRHKGSGVLWEIVKKREKELNWRFMMSKETTKTINVYTIKSLNSGNHKEIVTYFKYDIYSIPKAIKVLYDTQI